MTDSQRLRGLLDAHRVITSDLSLETMLDRIVTSAADLVGARYSALAVSAPDGRLQQFVHHGMDESTVAAIGALPRSRGLLGALVRDPRPIRVDDVATDPRATGMPPGHPPVTAFLAVPIRVRGELFGQLYLADPAAGTFSEADEELVGAFAATAGTAVENARLFEDANRSRDWLHASGEIARALLADADDDALLDVVSRALHVADADYGALLLPQDGRRMRVALTVGTAAERYRGLVFDPADSAIGRAIVTGRSLLAEDMGALSNPHFADLERFGPIMVTPLVDAKGIRGAVMLVRAAGRAPFRTHDLDLSTTFADQVALALELNDARADAESLRVLQDRHRIAQDLHDNVMQRLFAIGVGLEGLANGAVPEEARDRLRGHVGDLDDTIDDIRGRVFGLRSGTVTNGAGEPLRFPHPDPAGTAHGAVRRASEGDLPADTVAPETTTGGAP